MTLPESEKLNPQVTDIEIGIRNLRNIKMYPLSIANQLELTGVITKAISGYMIKEEEGGSDLGFLNFVLELIKENIGRILSLITDHDGDELLIDMTNGQLISIVNTIYVVNYEDNIKNAQSLFEKAKNKLQLKRPLPQSANATQDTDLNISTKEPIKMEESPLDN